MNGLIVGGASLCILGGVVSGTAFAPIQGNPDPTNTYTSANAGTSPTAFIQLLSGVTLLGVGVTGVVMGCGQANQEEERAIAYQQMVAAQAQAQEIAASNRVASAEPHQIQAPNPVVVPQAPAQELPEEVTAPMGQSPYVEPIVEQIVYSAPEPVIEVVNHAVAVQPSEVNLGYQQAAPTYSVYYEYEQEDAWEEPKNQPTYAPEPEPDEYEEVRSLVHEGNVGIIGAEKGSGKTSKLGYLIGEHIKLGHLVWGVNPFCAGREFKGIKVYGRGYNFRDAADGIRKWTNKATERMKKRGDETLDYDPFEDVHIHLALDELSNYGRKLDEIDATVMVDFWETSIQMIRQMNMSVSFASHGDTQSLLGGEASLKGKSTTIKNGITWVYARAVTDTSVRGNKRCAGWADYVHFIDGQRKSKRITIPSWMQGPPDYNYIELVKQHCPQHLYLPKPKAEPGRVLQFQPKSNPPVA